MERSRQCRLVDRGIPNCFCIRRRGARANGCHDAMKCYAEPCSRIMENPAICFVRESKSAAQAAKPHVRPQSGARVRDLGESDRSGHQLCGTAERFEDGDEAVERVDPEVVAAFSVVPGRR
jgi:hypothetical protein